MNRESTLLWSRRSAALLVLALLVVMAFRIGSSSSAEVQFRDPTAWLESAATGEVIKINGATSEVSARIEVAEPGNDLDVVQAGPSAFVLDTNAMRLGNADGVLLRLLPTIDISGTVGRPMLAASENAVFVIDDDSVAVFSATDLAAEESFALDSPLLQVVADSNGSVWGVDQAGGLIHADKDRIRRTTPTDAVGEALEVVAVAGEPYLIDFSTDQAWHVTPKGGLGESICIAGSPGSTARSGGTTAADDDRFILISDGASGKLHLGELDSGECDVIDIAAPGSELGSPVEAAGTSYVANYTTGQVTIIDLAARRVLRTVRVSSPGVIDLIVKDGLVWFNDPDGANAGIIEVDRVRPVSKFDTSNAGEGIGGSEVAETGSSLDDAGVASAEVTGGEQGSGAIDGDGPGESGAESSALADDGGGDKESILPPIGDDPSLVPAEEPDAVDEPEPVVEDPSDSAELDEPLPVDTDRLQADFSFSSDQIQVGEEVTLADSSLGSPDSWSWTFDDGTSANGPRIRKSWPIEGTYVVTLFVDNSTDSDSAEHTFVVLPNSVDIAPRADFRFDNGTIETGDSVRFTDRSTGSPTRLEWNFGDGRTATGNSVTNSYAAPGRYTVTLRASNNAGSDTATVSILVLDSVEAPTAIISVATLSAEVGDFIVFRSQSTGTPTSLEWDFDDESGASGTEVQHSFSTPGTYQVSLTASNSAGSDTDTIAITIRAPIDAPVARIDGSSTRNVSAGVELCFVSTSTKNPSSLSWDFGDGGTAAGQAVCHSYDEKGSYRVTLVAANAAGSDEARIRVRVAEPPPAPTASFVASPSRPAAGVPVSFTDTSINGPTQWAWDFGDGSSSAAQSPTHSYDEPGTYTVTLIAENAEGADTEISSITVVAPAPTADFTVSEANPTSGQPVEFSDTSRNSPNRWSWDFGDGSTSTSPNPTHSFVSPGAYSVVLKVWNDQGSDTSSLTVEVDPPPPSAGFASTPGAPNTTTAVTFTDTSTGGPTSWLWDFGDGSTWNGQSPQPHVFQDAGTHSVQLEACNAGGCDTVSHSVSVKDAPPRPVAVFSASPSGPVAVGTTVSFTDRSSNKPDTWRWTFSDGSSSTSPDTSKTYDSSGTFAVSLEVCNDGGCDIAERTIEVVIDPPNANFGFSPTGAVKVGQELDLLDKSSGGPDSWLWDFGDGTSSSAQNPTHSFSSPGSYAVTLTATNSGGSDSRTRRVRVKPQIPPTTQTPTTQTPTTQTPTTQTPTTQTPTTQTPTTQTPTTQTPTTQTPTTQTPTTQTPTTQAPTTQAPTTQATTTTTGTATQGQTSPWPVAVGLLTFWSAFIGLKSRRPVLAGS